MNKRRLRSSVNSCPPPDRPAGAEFPRRKPPLQRNKRKKLNLETQGKEKDPVNSSDEEWEDVENHLSTKESDGSIEQPLQIDVTWDMPKEKTRKTRRDYIVDYVKRMHRTYAAKQKVIEHKMNLLSLLVQMQVLNHFLSKDEAAKAFALSLIPLEFFVDDPDKWNRSKIKNFIDWFCKEGFYKLEDCKSQYSGLSIGCNTSIKSLALFFRALGNLSCKIVMSLQPVNPKIKGYRSPQFSHHTKCEENASKTSKGKYFKKKSKKPMTPSQKTDSLLKKMGMKKDHLKLLHAMSFSSSSTNSSHSNEAVTERRNGNVEMWIELFIPIERCWICIDSLYFRIVSEKEIESSLNTPLQYIVTSNEDGKLKDVTSRYSSRWFTETRKLRLDDVWWDNTVLELSCPSNRDDITIADIVEENRTAEILGAMSMPTSLSEYKNHPLYVLKKDLLKFQVLYPEDQPSIGTIKGHEIFPRSSVHTLQSRERWLIQEGRSIKPGEQPLKTSERKLKISKAAIPKMDLFASWQTERYQPGSIENGVIPRNSFGNVELYKPWMIPKGCVHLSLKGIGSIAKKLGIEAVPAVVSWEYGQHPHPLIDGVVVALEHSRLLKDEWIKRQKNEKKNAIDTHKKHVANSWKRIAKKLITRYNLSIKHKC